MYIRYNSRATLETVWYWDIFKTQNSATFKSNFTGLDK